MLVFQILVILFSLHQTVWVCNGFKCFKTGPGVCRVECIFGSTDRRRVLPHAKFPFSHSLFSLIQRRAAVLQLSQASYVKGFHSHVTHNGRKICKRTQPPSCSCPIWFINQLRKAITVFKNKDWTVVEAVLRLIYSQSQPLQLHQMHLWCEGCISSFWHQLEILIFSRLTLSKQTR